MAVRIERAPVVRVILRMQLLCGEGCQAACGHDPRDYQRGARNARWTHVFLPALRYAVQRALCASARLRTPSFMCAQPFTTPSRCSSVISPNARCWNLISVPPSTSLSRYCTFELTGYDMNSGP